MNQSASTSKSTAVGHPLGEKGLTFNQTVREIVEFLEVAIHTILFIRGVYPPDLFIRRRKWDAPVYQSRHPALNEYIAGAVGAVRDELILGKVDKMVLVIKNGQDVALERFIFSLQTVVQPGPSEMSRWNKDMVVQNSLPFLALPQHFRSFLVKLSLVEAQLGDLPTDEDMSFGIFLELQDGAGPSASKGTDPPPWIATHPQHTSAGTSDDAQLRVIRALETGVIDLALAIQESGEKLSGIGKVVGKSALR
ncbi:mitotic spindle assembly checkpoint protein MAD2B, putative [Rhizoctonia solani AG-3 Rhs1AP]|uniref:Mitotic spindle assembly checkpoint protein MAD2B, putative n=1 Tax=Rhizoctonia solani AG-3 Rhs1AP TaxID=1086054 RepID=X8J0I2_9AGAM|nr:mitotic spindle assembly checkpoint protein MAD2B, putative [Rhizoctonia solani AG-3 Rhs1AP]